MQIILKIAIISFQLESTEMKLYETKNDLHSAYYVIIQQKIKFFLVKQTLHSSFLLLEVFDEMH